MSWLVRWFRSRRLDRELDAEIRFHFDEHVREAMERGMSRRRAERDARLSLGGLEQVKERTRDVRGTRWLEDWWQDTRFAVRSFTREPTFTTVVVLTLALGIGSAIAIFSVVRPVLFEPLAYPDSDRLVSISDRAADGAPVPVTFGTFRELVERSRTLVHLAVYRQYGPSLTGDHEPERLPGQLVSAAYFDVLGVAAALGPGFAEEDDRVGGPRVVILSHGLWQRRYGGDEGIVGSSVRLDGAAARVVGVMPEGFENVTEPDAQIWSLLQYDASLPGFDGREWGHHLSMIGRIRPGVDLSSARADLRTVADNPRPDFARPVWAALGNGLVARPLREAATAASRPVMLTLLGAVLLLLGIACVNVANLLIARGQRRRGELGVRAALGAGRGRLIRQLLTEGLLLAGLGGVSGLLVAQVGVAGLVKMIPPGLVRAQAIELDTSALGLALALTALVALTAGLTPALGRRAVARRGDGRVRAAGRRRWATRRVLVVAEVALALVLLVGAGLMARTVGNLFAIAPGFDPSGVLVLQVQVAGDAYRDDAATHRFFREVLEAAAAVPGVGSAAWTSQLPLSGDGDMYGVTFDGDVRDGTDGAAFRYAVSPDYFEAMDIPLVRGRRLATTDDAGAPRVAVISESLARRAFPDGGAVGGRLHVGPRDLPRYTIVGVAADVRQVSLGAEQTDAAYVVPEQWHFGDRARWLVVRSDRDPLLLVRPIERAVWSIDADQPVVRIDTMQSLLTRSEAQRRFALFVLEAFAALALLLAAVGLYGVLSGAVTERSHEIGVRSALGATREQIVALVVGQGLALAGLGTAIGLASAALLSGALDSLLFGISRLDPVTYGSVSLALLAVSALACWLPATRASRVDPVSTLRAGGRRPDGLQGFDAARRL